MTHVHPAPIRRNDPLLSALPASLQPFFKPVLRLDAAVDEPSAAGTAAGTDLVHASALILALGKALPGELARDLAIVDRGAHAVLEHRDVQVSTSERDRVLVVAGELLLAAGWTIWHEPEHLEVSPPGAPHYARAEGCPGCGNPTGHAKPGCICAHERAAGAL